MENFLSWNWLVPASMVVMLLELVMVVSKVLLNANPLQVHLQPFASVIQRRCYPEEAEKNTPKCSLLASTKLRSLDR